jgi:hypothetical protein
MEICLVFTPSNPRLFTLNATAWLVLDLCDGRPLHRIERAFRAAVGAAMPGEDAVAAVRQTIAYLAAQGMVAVTPA